MIRTSPGAWRHAARAAAASLACAFLAACGSGGVTDNTVTSSGPIAITPSTATLYSNLPTTFLITGGTGTYNVLSSDQAIVSVAQTVKGNSLTIVPNDVSVDTTVMLSVSDAAGAAVVPATATLVVKPRTISNTVTVTPSTNQCGTAVCSGGDAEIKATLAQAAIPLVGRQVRFDVVSGDLGIITSAPGLPETVGLSGTTTTDSSGTARIRVRVVAGAPSQTAIMRITDTGSGFTQTTGVTISALSLGALVAQPADVTFIGPSDTLCASGTPSADVIVSGGRPPYQISQPSTFLVSPAIVSESGGRFTVTPNGQCVTSGTSIGIVDAAGATATVKASNVLGPAAPAPSFTASPTSVTLSTCQDVANVSLSGGSGTYVAASGSAFLVVTVTGSIGSIQYKSPATIPNSFSATVTFSDGKTSQPVSVHGPNPGPTC